MRYWLGIAMAGLASTARRFALLEDHWDVVVANVDE